MTDWYGWAGTILNVDLTNMKVSNEELSPEFAARYIGASGFGARILYDEVGPEVDPLSPENIIIIGSGPLGGTIAPSGSRYELISKSPLTGILGRSNGGGFFGSEMKFAGYDLIVIRGKAEKPVYLWLNDGRAEIRDAAHLWGTDAWSAQHLIQQELNSPDIQTLKIGPAGENMCFSSCVTNSLGRAAGMTSIGAVWGSKNLKAVAALGNKEVKVARPKEFGELCQALIERAKTDPMYSIHTKYGTSAWVSQALYKQRKADLDALYDKNLSCFGCAYHCSHFYSVKSGKYKGTAGEGFEGFHGGLAAGVGINDPAFMSQYNNLCNQLGVHICTPYMAIAWAMDLYQDGIITKEDTEGLEITPGNEEMILSLVRKIAYKEGFGAILDDPIRGADMLGRGSDQYITHIKRDSSRGGAGRGSRRGGVEAAQGTGNLRTNLYGAVYTRRGAHSQNNPGTRVEYSDEHMRKLGRERYNDSEAFFKPNSPDPVNARWVYDVENIFALCDMTGACRFASEQTFNTEGVHLGDFARLMSAATGIDFNPADLIEATERKLVLERAFNAREGIRRVDDYPYPFHYLLKYGKQHPHYDYTSFNFSLADYDMVLDEYYKLRGCDRETGIPSREK
ncbi:MAG: aldehyde ferredoxin oxidoreductase N-terminal domain-containing protein, partial [Dehalococcoidales bacterium]|nr:aldehyde ferredoxin oxidoreductase N-terminal domain-containing protein [Dehalococcoidales bacterium]